MTPNRGYHAHSAMAASMLPRRYDMTQQYDHRPRLAISSAVTSTSCTAIPARPNWDACRFFRGGGCTGRTSHTAQPAAASRRDATIIFSGLVFADGRVPNRITNRAPVWLRRATALQVAASAEMKAAWLGCNVIWPAVPLE